MAATGGAKLLSRAGLGGFLQRRCGLWGCGSPWGVQSQQHRQFFWRKWKSSHSVVRQAVIRPAYSVPKIGMMTDEIDFIVHQETIRHNAYPSPLRYGGFAKSVCTSVNNVVCHGIPDTRQLQDGDIINVDVTVYLEGYHGDTSETFLIGCVDEVGRKLVKTAMKCRDEAIAACKPGAPLCVIEPILMEGSSEFRILKDKWTAVSADDKRSHGNHHL
ncbi:hypothetical protein J4Q44_G00190730 [Coregonus suidteri]|uniref:Peptidase M24 domain-containing protein n=1 Tax=Coregonus suidteri TaxID=861788 RepID=A0AAN8LHS6_9TELE